MENIEQEVCDFISEYFVSMWQDSNKIVVSLDDDLRYSFETDIFDVEDLMENFFKKFNVNSMHFNMEFYYPECVIPLSIFLIYFIISLLTFFLPQKIRWWLFTWPPPITIPDLTVRMLVESAKAGHWLYDPVLDKYEQDMENLSTEQKVLYIVFFHTVQYLSDSVFHPSRKELPKCPLLPETHLDVDIRLHKDMAIRRKDGEKLMGRFFYFFNVNPMGFNLEFYYGKLSWIERFLQFLPNKALWFLFPSTKPAPYRPFTIRMLVESAKAGYWLHDPVEAKPKKDRDDTKSQ